MVDKTTKTRSSSKSQKKGKKDKEKQPSATPEEPKQNLTERFRITFTAITSTLRTMCSCCTTVEPKDYWQPFVREGKRKIESKDTIDVDTLEKERLAGLDRMKTMRSNNAAIIIQSLIRQFLAKVHAKKMWNDAMDAASAYWENYWHMRWLANQNRSLNKNARQKFIANFVNNVFSEGALLYALKSEASTIIQKYYRGYLVRRLKLLNKKPKKWKKRLVTSRFSVDVYRRMWGRSLYEPVGGWPIQETVLEYDMWDHVFKPPKGRQFGIRTKKVIAVPRSQKEKDVLMHDGNAWVGVPISWEEEVQGVLDNKALLDVLTSSKVNADLHSGNTQGLTPQQAQEWRTHTAGISKVLEIMRCRKEYLDLTRENSSHGRDMSPGSPSRSKKPTILQSLLEATPYKDPIIKPPGYIPLNPEELYASLKDTSSKGMGKDKALHHQLNVPKPFNYDEAWLIKSVAEQAKSTKRKKQLELDHPVPPAYVNTLLTYRGEVNEITGEYSTTSVLTGESALSHLLHAEVPGVGGYGKDDPWMQYDTSRNERNYGQLVYVKGSKQPIAAATPIRGARKPLTERHRVSMEVEKMKTATIRENQLLELATRMTSPSGDVGGFTSIPTVATAVLPSDEKEEASLDPHAILLGKDAHRNHVMSSRSQKIMAFSKWSLMQHRYHHAQQAILNWQRTHSNSKGVMPFPSSSRRGGSSQGGGSVGKLGQGNSIASNSILTDPMVSLGVGRNPQKLFKGGDMDKQVYDDKSSRKQNVGSPDKGNRNGVFTGSVAPGSSWTEVTGESGVISGSAEPSPPEQDPTMEAIMGYWTSSPWGIVKQQVAEEVEAKGLQPIMPYEEDMGLKTRAMYKPKPIVVSKARVWAVKPRRHYKLRYSWLPQPLVNRAAIMTYDPPTGIAEEISDKVVPSTSIKLSPVRLRSLPGSPSAAAIYKGADDELSQITGQASNILSESEPQYVHQEVNGKRWTSLVSNQKPIGANSPMGSNSSPSRNKNAVKDFSPPSSPPPLSNDPGYVIKLPSKPGELLKTPSRPKDKSRGSNAQSQSHKNSVSNSTINSVSIGSSNNNSHLNRRLQKHLGKYSRHGNSLGGVYVDSSEEEEDEDDRWMPSAAALNGKGVAVARVSANKDNQLESAAVFSEGNSYSTLPTASQFSNRGVPSSPTRSASSHSPSRPGKNPIADSRKSVFDPEYYATMHAEMQRKKRETLQKLVSNATAPGAATPIAVNASAVIGGNTVVHASQPVVDKLHPYVWL